MPKREHTLARARRDALKKTAALGSAGVAAALGFPAIIRAQSDTIKIGHLTPRTGFLGQIGEYGVKGATLAVGTSKAVTCSIGKHAFDGGEKELLELEGEVGEEAGTRISLTATGIKCLNAKIFNENTGKTPPVVGKDSGELEFTGVTVMTPPNCTVQGNKVVTKPLVSELYTDPSNTTIGFDKFEPATAGGNFATVVVEGPSCSIAGNRIAKGFVFGEGKNATGTSAVTQPITFSPTIDTTAGSALVFAGNPAHLTGQVINKLSTGEEFSAK